jgi:hypothetical protein
MARTLSPDRSASSCGGGSITLTHDGLTNQVASDSSASYSRDPAGQITEVSTTTPSSRPASWPRRPARWPGR